MGVHQGALNLGKFRRDSLHSKVDTRTPQKDGHIQNNPTRKERSYPFQMPPTAKAFIGSGIINHVERIVGLLKGGVVKMRKTHVRPIAVLMKMNLSNRGDIKQSRSL